MNVGFRAVGFFDLAPGAAPLHALVGKQDHAFLAIARALYFHGLAHLQRERAVQFRELLRGNQALGLAAQIHHHAEVGNGHNLARFDLALRRRLVRRGVLLHELFHFGGRLGCRLAGFSHRFHYVANVGMLHRRFAVRRSHGLGRRKGNYRRFRRRGCARSGRLRRRSFRGHSYGLLGFSANRWFCGRGRDR